MFVSSEKISLPSCIEFAMMRFVVLVEKLEKPISLRPVGPVGPADQRERERTERLAAASPTEDTTLSSRYEAYKEDSAAYSTTYNTEPPLALSHSTHSAQPSQSQSAQPSEHSHSRSHSQTHPSVPIALSASVSASSSSSVAVSAAVPSVSSQPVSIKPVNPAASAGSTSAGTSASASSSSHADRPAGSESSSSRHSGGSAGSQKQLSADEKKQLIKKLIDWIPAHRDKLFNFPIYWNLVDLFLRCLRKVLHAPERNIFKF